MKKQKKEKAITLRRQGHSFKEISERLDVSKSTCSLWLRNVSLSNKAQARLEAHCRRGIMQGIATLRDKSIAQRTKIKDDVWRSFNNLPFSRKQKKVACALLYWAEGEKNDTFVGFTNSDPEMVKVFVRLLRVSFQADESKFRMLLHLHDYHDERKQKLFWSRATGIPVTQFNKSYRKPHTGKQKRDNYPGCASLRYYDYRVALELKNIYHIVSETLGA